MAGRTIRWVWMVVAAGLLALSACSDEVGSQRGGDDASDASDVGLGDAFPRVDTGEDASTDTTVEVGEDTTTPACGELLRLRSQGGLGEFGPWSSQLVVWSKGHVWYDDYAPDTPIESSLDAATLDELVTLLAAVDPDALEDGYGACCASDADGTDYWISFANAENPSREVRISDELAAPEALRAVLDAARALPTELPAGSSQPALSHPIFELPASDPGSCEEHHDLGPVFFLVAGPDGQHIDTQSINVDGQDIEVDSNTPYDWSVQGTVVEAPEGSVAVETDGGETWTVTFDRYPSSLPWPDVVPDQRITLHVRIAWAFDLNISGLYITDDRGVIFVSDEGLSDIAELVDGLSVEVTSGGCAQTTSDDMCGPSGEQALAVTDPSTGTNTTLFPGGWMRIPMEGYDLALLSLRSYQSGYCDDYWNYAYAAVALSGAVCE